MHWLVCVLVEFRETVWLVGRKPQYKNIIFMNHVSKAVNVK